MDINLTSRLRFARALQSWPFALLWIGQTISSLGNGAFGTALAWEVLILTRSATAMSIIVIAQVVPSLLFMALGGVAADRLPRRLVMLCSDAGRAVILLAVVVLAQVHLLQLWHFIVLSLLFGIVQCFFFPAYQAILPQLVETEALRSANALTRLSQQMSALLGPLLGTGCVALLGPVSAFAFNGVSFTISAGCLLMVQPTAAAKPALTGCFPSDSHPLREAIETPSKSQGIRGVFADLREGLSYVAGSTWLWLSIVVAALFNMCLEGPLEVSLPKLIYDVYHSGVWLLGAVATAGAIGSITATFCIGQLHGVRRRGILAYLSMMLASVALVGFGLPLPLFIEPLIACLSNAVIGFGLGIFGVIWITVLQELVPDDKLGRVSSLDWLGSFGLTPIGYALAGVLTDHLGPSFVFVACGVLNVLFIALALCVRDIQRLE